MELKVRRSPYTVPSYSLTSDLLSFLRCGLQYRYHGIGKLPATRPAQMWFGQFIHGVLEEAYWQYRTGRDATGDPSVPPASDEQLSELCDLLAVRLAAQGLAPRNEDLERIGVDRARAAVQELGPLLFPVISQAEVRLTGTRAMRTDLIPARLQRGIDRYEMAGVVDVITDIELGDHALAANPLVDAIRRVLPPGHPERFEVIIDYKGMRRPPKGKPSGGRDFWRIYEWQVQTYAQLRSVQAGARPVAAAVLLYLNELLPTWTDSALLRREIDDGTTDVAPESGGAIDRLIRPRPRGDRSERPPLLPFEFRLQRALRIVPVSPATQDRAAEAFDKVVAEIEASRVTEQHAGAIIASWPKDTSDAATCAACDFRPVCPDYQALPHRV